MTNLRAGVLLFCFVAMVLLAFAWQGIAVKFKLKRRKTFPPRFHAAVCRLFGIKVVVVGKPIDDCGSLLIANHTSYLDVFILGSTAPMSFVARHDAAQWPFVGTMVRLQESVLVERRRRGKVGQQRDGIRARMAMGDRIAFFPEGTTSDNNRILPFKSSLLGAAMADGDGVADFPIQPATISYVAMHGMPMNRSDRYSYAWVGDFSLFPHVWNMLKAGPLDVVVEFHPPLSSSLGRKEATLQAETLVRAGWRRAAKNWRNAA
jgi:lyso-ornithine lipid O-acyltransferase